MKSYDKHSVLHCADDGLLVFMIDIQSTSFKNFVLQDKVVDALVQCLPVLIDKLVEEAKKCF